MEHNSHHRVKVAFLMDFPVPYRERTFEKFAAYDMNLTVYYCARRVPGRDWIISSGTYEQRFLPGWSFGAWFYLNPRIVRELMSGKYEVLVIYGYAYLTALLALVTARTLGIPVVMRSESTLTDHANMRRSKRARLIKGFLLRPVLRLCNLLAPSGTLASEYLQHYGAPVHKCMIVPTACDVEKFQEIADATRQQLELNRRQHGLNEDYLTFVYSGRLIPLKQVDKLIGAFGQLKEKYWRVQLLIVGDGPERQSLEKAAQGIPDVHFVGFQTQESLAVCYGLSDVFVFPSQGDVWGVVVNEAMACGLPVISNPTVGAVADMVTHGVNGIITSGSNAAELHAAMERYAQQPGLAKEMGLNARQVVIGWTHEAAVSAFRRVVDRLVGPPVSRGSKP